MFKEDCAICFRLVECQEMVTQILSFIKLSCGSGKKVDFGLHYTFMDSILGELRKAQTFHSDYHMREDKNPSALKPPSAGVKSSKPKPRYRKWNNNGQNRN